MPASVTQEPSTISGDFGYGFRLHLTVIPYKEYFSYLIGYTDMTSDVDKDLMRFGALIRHARIAAGLRQKELADQVGTKQATISEVEQGKARITLPLVLALMNKLGLQIVDAEGIGYVADDLNNSRPEDYDSLDIPDVDDLAAALAAKPRMGP